MCSTSCVVGNFIHGLVGIWDDYVQTRLTSCISYQADLLLSFGHGNDLKALTVHIPRQCQCLLMSATIRCVSVVYV